MNGEIDVIDEINWGVRVRRKDGSHFLATNGYGIVAVFKRRHEALELIRKLSAPMSNTNPRPHIHRRQMKAVKLRVRIEDA